MPFFETMESMHAGRHFWRTLERLRRLPFDCVETGRSATLVDKTKGLALLVVPQDLAGSSQGFLVVVRLLDVPNEAVLVDASLDQDLNFIEGSAFGQQADELAASETLSMCGAGIYGDWELVAEGEPIAEEDEDE